MVKRCVYCNVELEEDFVVDICQTCMYKVWGPKMSQAIISGMEKERAKGNMELGRVSEKVKEETKILVENEEVGDIQKIEKVVDSFNESFVEQLPKSGSFFN